MSVNENIKGAETVEEREEGDAGSDLSDDVSDFSLDLLLVFDSVLHYLAIFPHLRLYLELPPLQGLLGLHAVQHHHKLLDLPHLQPVLDLRENIF